MPMTTLGFMVSQSLPYAGKRELSAGPRRETRPARASRHWRVRGSRVEAAVTRAYYGLLLTRELQTLTNEQREVWRQVEVVTRARYAVGQGAQQDVLRVQVEVTRIEQRAIEQASEAELRLAELNRLLARPIGHAARDLGAAHTAAAAAPPTDAVEQARAVSPELAGRHAGRRHRAAAARTREARVQARLLRPSQLHEPRRPRSDVARRRRRQAGRSTREARKARSPTPRSRDRGRAHLTESIDLPVARTGRRNDTHEPGPPRKSSTSTTRASSRRTG